MLNPITVKRIELVCGSVETFLADPSKFRDKFQEPNNSWMCTVSKEDATNSLKRLQKRCYQDKSEKLYFGYTKARSFCLMSRYLLPAPANGLAVTSLEKSPTMRVLLVSS